MYAKNCTEELLRSALYSVSKWFAGNIVFKRIEPYGRKGMIRFILTVVDSKGPGAVVTRNGRRVKAACWHVHGLFFDVLLFLDDRVVIQTSTGMGKPTKVYCENGKIHGNWIDWDTGQGYYASDRCECQE